MQSIQTTMQVLPDGTGRLASCAGLAPGEHRVVLTLLDDEPEPAPELGFDEFLAAVAAELGPWPEGLSLRREDMYGDDGR